jgi:hypothetical protein
VKLIQFTTFLPIFGQELNTTVTFFGHHPESRRVNDQLQLRLGAHPAACGVSAVI